MINSPDQRKPITQLPLDKVRKLILISVAGQRAAVEAGDIESADEFAAVAQRLIDTYILRADYRVVHR